MHLFSKENIWSNPAVSCIQSSHPDKHNNSVDRIISKEEEREDPRRDSSIYLRVQNTVVFPQIIHSTRTTVSPHAIQQLQVILHTELTLLQEISKKYYNYKAHPMQIQGIFQQLFPMSPSILYGRIRFLAPLQYKQASSNSTR